MLIQEIQSIKSTTQDLRNFGLVIGGTLIIISLWQLTHFSSSWLWFLAPGILIVFLGFFASFLLKPFQIAWMTLAVLMGWFMTKIILLLTFFLVFVTISFLAKIFKKKLLDLEINSNQRSYWTKRQEFESPNINLEKQF